MPHLSFEYSANMEARLDIAGLCRALRDAALETGIFPAAGIRVRGFRADHVVIADGNPEHGFIDLSVRLRAGRSAKDKVRATAHIFAAMERYCAAVLEGSSLMLSMELSDIDPDLSPKSSSIRKHLPEEFLE
jgi:5-carboxymethyl-2-hydroxymuconate isomerase